MPVVTSCYACRTRLMPGDMAFLAGIAFAFQYNNNAKRGHLCEDHAAALIRGAQRTEQAVAETDRREP